MLVSRRFQPEEGPRRDLFLDLLKHSFEALLVISNNKIFRSNMENIYVAGDRAGRGGGGGALDGAAALVAVAGGGRGLPRPPHLRRQPPPQGRGGHRRREGAQVSVYRDVGAHFTC